MSASARRQQTEPPLASGLPHHRAIVALDIERSTSRPDPVKAGLRSALYELFDAALRSAGIHQRVHLPGTAIRHNVTEMASYRQPA